MEIQLKCKSSIPNIASSSEKIVWIRREILYAQIKLRQQVKAV